jgi:hypothetical protein
MKQAFKIICILIFLLAVNIKAQSAVNRNLSDTLKTSIEPFLNDELNRNLSNPNSLNKDFTNFQTRNLSLDTSSIWLQARMQVGETVNDDQIKSNFNLSVLNPLRQQLSDIESMKVMKYILTTVQVGAVGYLAYQHIKKYGFLKK